MYYVFATEKEAQEYNDRVKEGEAIPDPFFWSNIFKHPTKNQWAITAHDGYGVQGKVLQTLDSSWSNL